MNNDDFLNQLREIVYARHFNPNFVEEWFTQVLKTLETLSEQSSLINHPRHRGDSREDQIIKVLREIIPPSFPLTKGYAVNDLTCMSKEQDCLICNGNLFSKLASTDSISYIPIDSVLASVEIKSNLDLDELRKCIINCASLKSIQYEYNPAGAYKNENDRIIYSIFSYKSDKSLEEIRDLLLELSQSIPNTMWINQIYIMNKGLIKPCHTNGNLYIAPEIKITGSYGIISDNGKNSNPAVNKALPFLWFLSNIVDNIIMQSYEHRKLDTISYFFRPMIFQQEMQKKISEQNKESSAR